MIRCQCNSLELPSLGLAKGCPQLLVMPEGPGVQGVCRSAAAVIVVIVDPNWYWVTGKARVMSRVRTSLLRQSQPGTICPAVLQLLQPGLFGGTGDGQVRARRALCEHRVPAASLSRSSAGAPRPGAADSQREATVPDCRRAETSAQVVSVRLPNRLDASETHLMKLKGRPEVQSESGFRCNHHQHLRGDVTWPCYRPGISDDCTWRSSQRSKPG